MVDILSLKTGRAKDVHDLTAEHVKVAAEIVVYFLTPVINVIFNSGSIPKTLKQGVLHPVHKKGKVRGPR